MMFYVLFSIDLIAVLILHISVKSIKEVKHESYKRNYLGYVLLAGMFLLSFVSSTGYKIAFAVSFILLLLFMVFIVSSMMKYALK